MGKRRKEKKRKRKKKSGRKRHSYPPAFTRTLQELWESADDFGEDFHRFCFDEDYQEDICEILGRLLEEGSELDYLRFDHADMFKIVNRLYPGGRDTEHVPGGGPDGFDYVELYHRTMEAEGPELVTPSLDREVREILQKAASRTGLDPAERRALVLGCFCLDRVHAHLFPHPADKPTWKIIFHHTYRELSEALAELQKFLKTRRPAEGRHIFIPPDSPDERELERMLRRYPFLKDITPILPRSAFNTLAVLLEAGDILPLLPFACFARFSIELARLGRQNEPERGSGNGIYLPDVDDFEDQELGDTLNKTIGRDLDVPGREIMDIFFRYHVERARRLGEREKADFLESIRGDHRACDPPHCSVMRAVYFNSRRLMAEYLPDGEIELIERLEHVQEADGPGHFLDYKDYLLSRDRPLEAAKILGVARDYFPDHETLRREMDFILDRAEAPNRFGAVTGEVEASPSFLRCWLNRVVRLAASAARTTKNTENSDS